MGSFATVTVRGNKYRIKGDFHHLSQSTPIRDADHGWKLVGICKPRELTHIHTYGSEAVFFEALSQGKILATRCESSSCDGSGSTYLPFRIHCPDCLERNAVVDVTEQAKASATIHTFMTCERSGAFNTLEKPIRFINLEFDGICTILMSYLAIGEPEIGKRVVPIFRKQAPTYTITDLAWVEENTPASKLPQDFRF